MDDYPYWQRQTVEKPLFQDLLWSRPENKRLAGKLLIIGGHAQSFAAAAESFATAEKAGAGSIRVLLPDYLHKTVPAALLPGEFAPSTPSGSFAKQALSLFLEHSAWADAVLVAGDLGHNSETAILLEAWLDKFTGPVTLTKDAVDYISAAPKSVIDRFNTTLVLSFAQLQKLGVSSKFTRAFTFDMGALKLVEMLHEFTQNHKVELVVKYLDQIIVAVNGQVSSTKLQKDLETWRVQSATYTSIWRMQNPSKPFEALTTALIAQQG